MAERISTPSKTKEIIEANRFAFKKNFGQNFLIDSNILDNIAACAGVTKEDCVLEIGPGIGSLTQVLAENAGQVVAVEIDNTLIPILKQTLADYDNIEILNQDILKTDIDAIIREKNDGRPIKVVANLPYYITTPIIMGLFESGVPIDNITNVMWTASPLWCRRRWRSGCRHARRKRNTARFPLPCSITVMPSWI